MLKVMTSREVVSILSSITHPKNQKPKYPHKPCGTMSWHYRKMECMLFTFFSLKAILYLFGKPILEIFLIVASESGVKKKKIFLNLTGSVFFTTPYLWHTCLMKTWADYKIFFCKKENSPSQYLLNSTLLSLWRAL